MKENKGTICLIGCGGHARSVADVILAQHPKAVLVFLDQMARPNEKLLGFDIKKPEDFLADDAEYFIAVGNNRDRKDLYNYYAGNPIITIVSSLSYVSNSATLGTGTFVGNFAHIGPEAKIGDNTIINTAAIVEHEVTVGNHSHVGPNASISGRSSLGDNIFVGAGATIIDKVHIVGNVMIGAGATVVKDINEPGVYVGCPAKKIK